MLSQIDDCRHEQSDIARLRKLVDNTPTIIPPKDICLAKNGRVNIRFNNIEFECVLNKRESSGELIVFFSGFKNDNNTLPLFRRWSYADLTESNVLSIADPMLRKYEDIRLGWYYGTKEENYLDYISEIVMICAEQLHIRCDNIIFYSSSGGGFAALYCACKVKGSTAVVINPQIKLSADSYCQTFESITGISLSEDDCFQRNNLPDLIMKSSESKFIIIENLKSADDMEQLQILCKVNGAIPQYGLTWINQNVLTWVYDADYEPQHNAQEWKTMFWAIEFLAKNLDKIDDYKYLYNIFNELWHDHYSLKDDERRFRRRYSAAINVIPEIIDEGKISYHKEFSGQVQVKNENNKHNYCCICKKLRENIIYRLSINISYCESDGYTLSFKDELCNIELTNLYYENTKEKEMFFLTGAETNGVEVRIYPNTPDNSENKELKAYVELDRVVINGCIN